MNLKIKNTWEYKGNDWWEWAAYLDDGGSGELTNVNFVEYVLHETFPEPIVKVKKQSGGFKMNTAGWGIFNLKAFVHLKNGKKVALNHMIQLEYTPAKGTST
jgi:transcription initiation factor IIF auxiliary subunit